MNRHPTRPTFNRVLASLAGVLVACFATGGCGLGEWARNGGRVGPNYVPPDAPIASNWIDYKDSRIEGQEEQDLSRWWSVFGDPVLDELVADAARQNLSLNSAGSRIAQARARYWITVGDIFPQRQEAAGGFTANKASGELSSIDNAGSNQWFHAWDAGFNLSWELDLWGRFRRSIESADAELQASVADYEDVLVLLLADVSTNYVQYRTFEERARVARRNVEIQERSYALTQDKFQAGATTERDVQQSRQVLEQTRALIPQLVAGQRQAANALCVLLGIAPADLSGRLGDERTIPSAEPELALGIPADLLRRRPDVRRAERLAASQSAQIGVAKSDLYPRFAINGSIGVQAQHFHDLFRTPDSLAGSIGPSFRWDILNYGRIENNVKAQQARFAELVSNYQQSVLEANREAEDAIVGFLTSQERVRSLERSVAAAQRTVEITNDQYKEGAVDYTAVFLFEGTLADQEDQLAIARGQIALSLVALYRSLGGGWENGPPVDAGTTSPPPATQPVVVNDGGAPE